MATQIIDRRTVVRPGPQGDVTPAALAAQAAAEAARDESAALRDEASAARDQAEVFAAGVVQLQDSAVAALVSDTATATSAAVSGLVPPAGDPAVLEPAEVVIGVGDSLTHAWGTSDPWMKTTADLLGWGFVNHGVANQTAAQVAARMNASPAWLLFPNDSIPGSGSVTVTADVSPVIVSTGPSLTGTVLGVRGTLSISGTTLTFARETDGEPVATHGPAAFLTDQGRIRDGVQVFWVGRNGQDDGETMSALRALVSHRGTALDRFLVVLPPNGEGWADKTALRARIMRAFPLNAVDVPSLLCTQHAADIAGVTFTADDLSDIANGWPPRVFRTDAVHLNPLGRRVVGTLIAEELVARGWATGRWAPTGPLAAWSPADLPDGTLTTWSATDGSGTLSAPSGAEPSVVADGGRKVVALTSIAQHMDMTSTADTSMAFACVWKLDVDTVNKFIGAIYSLRFGFDGTKRWTLYGATNVTSAQTVDLAWHTIVVSRDGDTAALFVDGVQVCSGVPGYNSGAKDISIGSPSSLTPPSRFADVRVYSRPLTATDAASYHAWAVSSGLIS